MNALALLFATVATVLAALLWRERRQFRRLRAWLRERRLGDPPEGAGAWGEAFNLLHRHRRAHLKRVAQLARLAVRMRRAARALPYGVTVLDARMRIVWANPAAQAHLGVDAERDRGAPIANFLREPEAAAYLEARAFSQMLRLRHAEAMLVLQFVSLEEGGWMLLSRDVTAEERVEALRRDFVANVSHELKTPLTVLTGFLETLRDLDLDRQRMRDYVQLMLPHAERMRRIIEDLLLLSTLEHSPPPLEQTVAMRPMLERLRAEAEQLGRGAHRVSIEAAEARDLIGAETELASAFSNLVSNAVRYTPAGGEIRMRWLPAGAGGAEFVVEDTGIGIDAEHLPRLTERFYRVDRGRSSETGGTGLGLAIVKHALARHQATLEIRSTPGRGSRFAARFPASRLRADQNVPA